VISTSTDVPNRASSCPASPDVAIDVIRRQTVCVISPAPSIPGLS
jgi:hypothetical protein